jgi:hypothetical protein
MARVRVWAKRLAFILPIALVLTGPYTVWWLWPAKTLNVVIVDKTVPHKHYREHASLTWVLHAMKIHSPEGRFLDPARDYVGFDPVAAVGHELTGERLRGADVLFLADTYGVYLGDYRGEAGVAGLERSPRIYGGMSLAEADLVQRFAADGGMVIAEFNTFASPTAEPARAKLQPMFGVSWTRWAVRYWPRLEDMREVPAWLGRLYEEVYQRPYDLSGGGLVFVHEDSDILVLRAGEHLHGDVIRQMRTSAGSLLDVPDGGRFRFWMDVVQATDGEVLAEHVVKVTASGAAELARHGIPQRFPALTRRRDNFYFAGDFVDISAHLGDPERAGLLAWRQFTTGFGAESMEPSGYFFNWYVPIVSRLLASRAR